MATPTDPNLNSRVVKLYGDGLSIRKVAVRVKRSPARVQQILDHEGVPRRAVGTGREQ